MWLPAWVWTPSVAEEILDAERNAFERPRLARGDPPVGLGGHGERLLRRLADIGVEAARRLDRGDVGARELGRGEALGGEPVADLGDGERGEVSHGAAGRSGSRADDVQN